MTIVRVLCTNGEMKSISSIEVTQFILVALKKLTIQENDIDSEINLIWEFPSGNSISQHIRVADCNGKIVLSSLLRVIDEFSEQQMKNYCPWYIGDFTIHYDHENGEFVIKIKTYTIDEIIYRF